MDDLYETVKSLIPKPTVENVDGTPIAMLPPGWGTVSMETYLELPLRTERTAKFDEFTSFIRYVNKYKDEGSEISLMFAKDELTLTAIIDHPKPGPGGPRWGEHMAVFQTRKTDAWCAWSGSEQKVMSQADFAKFIYKNREEIEIPSGAELLETIETLKATAKGAYRNSSDMHTGSTEIVYSMKVSASGGTQERPLELPKSLGIKVAPFYGVEKIYLTADLILHIPRSDGDKVSFSYEFYRQYDVFEQLYGKIQATTEKETGLNVYRGSL